MEVNENKLIQGAFTGDKAAMEAIFNMYVRSSVKLAYLITNDWALAEDAVQEAFIRAFIHIKSFDMNKKFKPWLVKIVVNEAKRARKASAKYFVSDNISNEESSIEDRVFEDESRLVLFKKINLLDLKYRLPIILMYYHGFSEKEISKVLSIPATTVKSRLYKARQKLKNQLMEGSFENVK